MFETTRAIDAGRAVAAELHHARREPKGGPAAPTLAPRHARGGGSDKFVE
jgi:hypothetical protein